MFADEGDSDDGDNDEWEEEEMEYGEANGQAALEKIAEADRRPFPDTNDKRFPQESKLNGIRGLKASLHVLFDVV
jgi:hypothetical protein